MKKILIPLLFLPLFQPSPIIFGQVQRDTTTKYDIDYVDKKIDKSFDLLFANLDTLTKLTSAKPKKVIVEKLKYVKVYKLIPVYIPENDTGYYQRTFPADTLDNYLIKPPYTIEPTAVKKKSLIYKLSHPFKKHK